MRPRACWTLRASAISCAASRDESGIKRSIGCRRCRCRSCSRSAARPCRGWRARTCCARLRSELIARGDGERVRLDARVQAGASRLRRFPATSHLRLRQGRFVADMSGALYWPGEDALIVADLHLEKGSSLRQARPAAAALRHARDAAPPRRGHRPLRRRRRSSRSATACTTPRPPSASAARSCEILRIMQEDREWIWVTGNHDPMIGERLGGTVTGDIEVEGITLRHDAAAGAGHARDRRPPAPGGAAVAARLHRSAGPASSATACAWCCRPSAPTRAGSTCSTTPFAPLFGNDGLRVWMLGQEGLYPVATRLLKED